MLEHASFSCEATWALEINARACFFVFRGNCVLKITARACFEGTDTRNHCSSMHFFPSKALSSMLRTSFECTFDNASFSFDIPLEIALLRTVPCFELYFVRLHRRRKAPYANLVCIYLYRRLGGDTNREIDFGFGSCVRARGLDARWERGSKVIPPLSLFPFPPERPSLFP